MAVNLLPANVPIGYVNNDQNLPIYASPELTRALTNMMLQIGGQSSASPGDVTNLTAIGIEHGIRISGTLPTPTPDDIEVWSSADNILAHAVLQTHGLLSSWDWIGLTSADGVKYIWVRTVFKSGKKGNFVGPVSAEAGINTIPNPVTGLTATSIIGGIRISGTLPSDADLAGVELWENTVNNVNTATLRSSGLSDHYDRTGLTPANGTYYFWARTYNTSGARGVFVGPVSGTAGQVQSGNIASGAVAVAAFASGIEPVTIVSSVPSVLSTKTVFNTTNGKLYKWNGSAYIATTPTTDLSGQISAGQIAANAVTAGTIAANAVTAGTIAAAAVSTNELSSSAIFAGSLSVNGTTGMQLVNGSQVGLFKLDASGNLVIQGTAANKTIALLAPNSGGITVDDASTSGQTMLNLQLPTSGTVAGGLLSNGTVMELRSQGMNLGLLAGTLGANNLDIKAGSFSFSGSGTLVKSLTTSSSASGLSLTTTGGTGATPSIALSGTPTSAGSAGQISNSGHTYTFSGGNLAGAVSATFSGLKPGTTTGNNGWMLFVIDGTNWYVPMWQA
jgi:hypothetical protein